MKFGPVRAEDIKDYIAAGYKKDELTRSVQFNFKDRILLAPVEVMNSLKYLILALIFFGLLSGIHRGGYSFPLILEEGPIAIIFLLTAYLTGAVLSPALLAGFLTSGLMILLIAPGQQALGMIAWLLISGAVSSFLAMNFTGASTYTGLSGVRKEMRFFVPLQIALTVIGITLLIISKLN